MKKIISIFAVVLVLQFRGVLFLRLNLPLGKLHLSVRITTKTIISVLVVTAIIYVILVILRSQGISIPLPEQVIRRVLPPLGHSNIERVLQAITSTKM